MKAFITDSKHKTINDKTYIQLFGKLENEKSFSSISEFTPYFFIREKDLKKISNLTKKYKIEKTNLTNFTGEKVVKISSQIQAEISKLSSAIHKKSINTYEADINPQMRFQIDNDLKGSLEIKGTYTTEEKVDCFYVNPTLTSAEYKPDLKVLSLDIESDKKLDKLFCIGLYGKNYKKNFIISDKTIQHAVSCKSERDLLENFKSELLKYDPDIITGWHVIDFDLAFLKKKFEEYKMSFDLGRDNQQARIRISSGFFKNSSANIPGRQVLDALSLIRDPFIKEAPSIKHLRFDSLKLEDVSQEILGETKKITGKERHKEIEELYKNKKHKELVEYNLQDCKLVYEIIEKTGITDLAIERSSLTGMPLDRITASIAAFDSLYIREARKRGLVSPTMRYGEKEERITGGYVMDSKAGIYNNVLVLDFKSLYPSLMKTLNIDPASYLEKPGKKSEVIETVNKAYFKNQDGILPDILSKLHEAREKAKKEKRELSSYAIKIIMNSFFGVLASPNCRYFSLKMANAITHSAQFTIKLTAKKVEEMGYKVIYSDTDSIFVETNLEKNKANALGKQIEKEINEFYKGFIRKQYKRKSYLELEFEKQYLAFLLPPIRGSESGSKKRYAGLLENKGKEKLEIVGLEAIRGDWTEAAQDFQRKLLDKIFHKEEFAKFIKSYVDEIKSGKLDSKLVYRKRITKALNKYTKTTPPHVKAARKLDKLESNTISYFITEDGPEPVQKLKHKLNYKHYIDKQIKPIANTILFFFKKDFDEIIASSKQMKLFG